MGDVDTFEPLRSKRMVLIFDECHRSQFGENHQTIKEFFPNAQLFGFAGTPIFPENASAKQISGDVKPLKTTQDLFQSELRKYTITHAIEDRNVLRFHVDYFKPEGVAEEAAGRKPSGANSIKYCEQHKPSSFRFQSRATIEKPDGSRRSAPSLPASNTSVSKRL